MPKPRGGPFKAREPDTRFDGYLAGCRPPAYPWGHVHVTPVPVATQDAALDVRRGIYRAARHLGITAHHVEMTQLGDGRWVVRFELSEKADGKRAIVARVAAGEPLAYNLRRNQ